MEERVFTCICDNSCCPLWLHEVTTPNTIKVTEGLVKVIERLMKVFEGYGRFGLQRYGWWRVGILCINLLFTLRSRMWSQILLLKLWLSLGQIVTGGLLETRAHLNVTPCFHVMVEELWGCWGTDDAPTLPPGLGGSSEVELKEVSLSCSGLKLMNKDGHQQPLGLKEDRDLHGSPSLFHRVFNKSRRKSCPHLRTPAPPQRTDPLS